MAPSNGNFSNKDSSRDNHSLNQHRYEQWIKQHEITSADIYFYEKRMQTWSCEPTFLIISYVRNPDNLSYLDTISSLQNQLYSEWSLLLLTDQTLNHPAILDDSRIIQDDIKSFYSSHPKHKNINKPDWICLIEAGDMLAAEALFILADNAQRHDQWQCIYVDEDRIDDQSNRLDHRFKPDINIELLRSSNYIGRFLCVRANAFTNFTIDIGWPALTYSLALQSLDTFDRGAIGHISKILHHGDSRNDEYYENNSAAEILQQSLQEHLNRNQLKAEIKPGYERDTFFIDYHLSETPLVSIIIPTKDALDLVRPCIESLLEKTSYMNYEVILVDNNSSDEDALNYFNDLNTNEERVTVIQYAKPYNFSAINNFAATRARGEYLLFLNNDTLIIQEIWLDRMMALAIQNDVGIVGAKLYHKDATIQHAGVVCGMNGVANHILLGLSMKDSGYMNRAHLTQEYSVVTAACLLIDKALYESVNGMNEINFAVLFNDVDLCLKVSERGRRVIWTPHAHVIHYGSVSLKKKKPKKQEADSKVRAHNENLNMLKQWMQQLAFDPAFNRNLSLRNFYFTPDIEFTANWDVDIHDTHRVLAMPFNRHGVGHYRVIRPIELLTNNSKIQSAVMPNHDAPSDNDQYLIPFEVDVARMQPDVYFIHNGFHSFNIEMLKRNKLFFDFRQIMGMDDLMDNPPPGHYLHKHGYKDIKKRIRLALSFCDRLIVSTEPLAQAYRHYIDDIKIVPNSLDSSQWSHLVTTRNTSNKIRIGWAGAGHHNCDFDVIRPVILETLDKVHWVFFGDCPADLIQKVEYHPGVVFEAFPDKLASLNLDIAVAPLAYNKFNEARSHLKLLEYGILGLPVICSDIEPYQHLPVKRVKNNTRAWVQAIEEHINDIDASYAMGDQLKEVVSKNYLLDHHMDNWLSALTKF